MFLFVNHITRVNLSLQEKNLDVVRAAQMINGLLFQLQEYEENLFSTLVKLSKATAGELKISPGFNNYVRKEPKCQKN